VNVDRQWKWVIIDLEYAGKDGEVWEGELLVSWDEKTLEGHEGMKFCSSLDQKKRYRFGLDVYQLGKLILQCLGTFDGGDSMLGQFMKRMGDSMMEKRVVAMEYKCSNDCKRCAMFK
jgi:hypothetical protein